MICIYKAGNENYDGNGDAVLTPIECTHTQQAAGSYELTIRHPMDPGGKWMHIVEEAIIKAPVQEETIETAYSGIAADLYVTTADAALRSGTSEPTTITYSTWSQYSTYSVGSKVTSNNHNYQCIYWDADDIRRGDSPGSNPAWWTEIARTTAGSPVLVNLKSGTGLYYVEASSTTGWSKVCTLYGMEGYIKDSQIEFVKRLTPEETQPRVITTQLFRIRSVNVDSKNRVVTATAEHVSYDLSAILVKGVKFSQKNPAAALAWIQQGFMMDYAGTIATDMTSDDDGLYSGEFNGKNATFTLLDPDKGVVASLGAMYRRDNWDVFVMKKTNVNRGFQLRYRKNMLGVSWSRKTDQLITRVVPVAKAENGDDFFLSGLWVDSPYINNYPVIRMEWLKVAGQVGKDDGTETATNWTETTLRAEMQRKAEERFSIDKVDRVIHEITVDFEALGDTEEYKALRKFETVLMYDTVTVIDEEIGLSVTVEVNQIEYDSIRKKVTALKLTNANVYGGKNVAGFNVINNCITSDKFTDEAEDALTETAVDKSAEYTDEKADETYRKSTNYVGSKGNFQTYDEYIKDWIQQHYGS